MKLKALIKKELFFYLNNPVGFIVAILFAVFANFLFIKDLFLRGNSSMRPFFDLAPWLFLIFIPALTMRIFAEEKRTNTLEIILTLPVSEMAIVVAKFLALLIFICISLGLTISIPITLSIISKIAPAEIFVSYLGSLFIAALFLAISMFFSSVTRNQIVAYLWSAITIFFLIFLGGDFLANLNILTPLYQYGSFLKGIIDFRAVYYFTSATVFFIFLTILNLKNRD